MVKNKYEILSNAIDYGMIDLEYLQATIDMKKKQEILSNHPYTIYQGKDGKWYTYLPDPKKGRVKRKRNTREEIEQTVLDFYKEQEENPTLEEIFIAWNEDRLAEKEICEATHSRNQRDFDRYFPEIKDRKIKSVPPVFMENFLERQVSEKQLTTKAFSNLRAITKGIFKRARKKGFIDWSIETVFSDLEISRRKFKRVIKEDYQEVFSEEETQVMLEYLKTHLDIVNPAILLMFVTGIRTGELVTLKHSDFDSTVFNIRRTATTYKDNETGKFVYDVREFPKTEAGLRTVIIPPTYAWITEKIKKQNPDCEFIFSKNNVPFKTDKIRGRLYRLCKKLGIYKKSPHKIRKTYCSILIDSKIDTKMITDLMGHTDISCSEKHYHRNRKNLARKSEILGNIPDFQAN